MGGASPSPYSMASLRNSGDSICKGYESKVKKIFMGKMGRGEEEGWVERKRDGDRKDGMGRATALRKAG